MKKGTFDPDVELGRAQERAHAALSRNGESPEQRVSRPYLPPAARPIKKIKGVSRKKKN